MDEKKTLNEELNISSYLLAEGYSAENVSGFIGNMSIPQTTANIATLTPEEYIDKVKKLIGENGDDFDDASMYISPPMKRFDVYNIEDTKLLQQISSTGNTMHDIYQGEVICTSSHMAFIEKEKAEFPRFEMGGSTIRDWYNFILLGLPSSYLSTHLGDWTLSNEQLQSIVEEMRAIYAERLLSTERNNDEITATDISKEYRRRVCLGLEPDEPAIGTSNLIVGVLHHYLTNKAMTPENTQKVVELVKSRSHHNMETGVVVVIDTMPELPSLESFDAIEIEDEDRYNDKPLSMNQQEVLKQKTFAVRGGKMVPTGQYPKFMTNPKHNKKQRRKK